LANRTGECGRGTHTAPAIAAKRKIALLRSWKLALGTVVALALFGAAPTFPAQSPQRPLVLLDTTYAAPAGQQRSVPAGGDLQAALNSAQSGDTIILQAGATYTGNFTLPMTSGTAWIYVRSSALSSLPEGTRVAPAQASLMPKIVSPNTMPAISTAAGAHNFRFAGIEITTTWASTSATSYVLVYLEAPGGNTSLSQVPTDLVFDRCYIHGTPTGNVRRGIQMNSARTAVVDSYLSDLHEVGADSQALASWNGPGPFKIVNNYLEGAGENIMFGGADPTIPNLIPSDIEIRRNYLFKPLSWMAGSGSFAGIHWSVKNLFELKNAQRVLIDGNVLENNWADAQNGYGVLFTPRNQDGTAPWSVVRDVTFANNIVRHSGGGVNAQGSDNLHPSQPTQRILIQNNLFDDISNNTWNGTGTFLQVTDGGSDIVVDHNTVLQSGNIITATYSSALVPASSFVFTNNIVSNNQYGVFGDYGVGIGTTAISAYFPGSSFARNAIVGGLASNFPDNNYFPSSLAAVGFVDSANHNYALAPGSPYVRAGTDGKDVGVDFTAMDRRAPSAPSSLSVAR
jgi:predicted outer membrane repeat protein